MLNVAPNRSKNTASADTHLFFDLLRHSFLLNNFW